MQKFSFSSVQLSPEIEAFRSEVRDFIAEERRAGTFDPITSSWGTYNKEFSRRCGGRGFIGITWPEKYGGGERSQLERYVMTEEMIAAGAPVAAHWVADRQSGPQILANASEEMRKKILPRIASGECCFGIGMSEPDSGSDLASVRTRAVHTDRGWVINGTKIWTSNADKADYLIALVRTSSKSEDRHSGLTQFLIDMERPGVTVRPIYNLYGHHEFNEVIFEDYVAPENAIVGGVGQGWEMVTGELALERSGPDRYLSSYQLLQRLIAEVSDHPDSRSEIAVGRLVAHLATLRFMSLSIADMLQKNESPQLEAALVKDLGNTFEQEIPEVARNIQPSEPDPQSTDAYSNQLARTIRSAPCFSLRGGTREILRGIIAKGLGLR